MVRNDRFKHRGNMADMNVAIETLSVIEKRYFNLTRRPGPRVSSETLIVSFEVYRDHYSKFDEYEPFDIYEAAPSGRCIDVLPATSRDR